MLLPFPLCWNVAQYASFVVQLTGHASLRQGHLRGLAILGPPLLACAALSVALSTAALRTGLLRGALLGGSVSAVAVQLLVGTCRAAFTV